MDDLIISIPVIGGRAYKALKEAKRGQVVGLPSGGVFLRTETGLVLFLSLMPWHGPLTINLSLASGQALPVELHALFIIQSGSIFFPDSCLIIQFSQAERWSPPPRPDRWLAFPERVQRLETVTGRVRSRKTPALLLDGRLQSTLLSELATLRGALSTGQESGIIQALVDGLGRGPGLTPAGDDLALGFLLGLNRWGDQLCPHLPPEPINQALTEAARHTTTALSASLIECAARGLADERLMAALDGLVTGNLGEGRIVDHFLGWGHTSGAAAMEGMGLLLS